LTGAGFGTTYEAEWVKWWSEVTHVLGQEINRFHSILWVAMCMAADIEPPKQFAVHGWITVDGQKMSKSLGNVIAPEYLHSTFGLDGMRYLLAREFVFSGDGDYSDRRFRERFNADLANNLGNLVNRTTSMLQKYFGGEIIRVAEGDMSGDWMGYRMAMERFQFDRALEVVWRAMQDLNQDIDIQKPWTLAKEGKTDQLANHLYRWLESIRQIAWMLRPFMPETSDKILDVLATEGDRSLMTIDSVSIWGGIQVGQKIGVAPPLFPRVAIES
jgi:methionyl-tRNA synthetase